MHSASASFFALSASADGNLTYSKEKMRKVLSNMNAWPILQNTASSELRNKVQRKHNPNEGQVQSHTHVCFFPNDFSDDFASLL